MKYPVIFAGFLTVAAVLVHGHMTGADMEGLLITVVAAILGVSLVFMGIAIWQLWKVAGVTVSPDGTVRFTATRHLAIDVPLAAITEETAALIEHRSDDAFLPVRRGGHQVKAPFYEAGWYESRSNERIFNMEVPGRAIFHMPPGDGRDFHILVTARLVPEEIRARAANKLPIRKSDLIGG